MYITYFSQLVFNYRLLSTNDINSMYVIPIHQRIGLLVGRRTKSAVMYRLENIISNLMENASQNSQLFTRKLRQHSALNATAENVRETR